MRFLTSLSRNESPLGKRGARASGEDDDEDLEVHGVVSCVSNDAQVRPEAPKIGKLPTTGGKRPRPVVVDTHSDEDDSGSEEEEEEEQEEEEEEEEEEKPVEKPKRKLEARSKGPIFQAGSPPPHVAQARKSSPLPHSDTEDEDEDAASRHEDEDAEDDDYRSATPKKKRPREKQSPQASPVKAKKPKKEAAPKKEAVPESKTKDPFSGIFDLRDKSFRASLRMAPSNPLNNNFMGASYRPLGNGNPLPVLGKGIPKRPLFFCLETMDAYSKTDPETVSKTVDASAKWIDAEMKSCADSGVRKFEVPFPPEGLVEHVLCATRKSWRTPSESHLKTYVLRRRFAEKLLPPLAFIVFPLEQLKWQSPLKPLLGANTKSLIITVSVLVPEGAKIMRATGDGNLQIRLDESAITVYQGFDAEFYSKTPGCVLLFAVHRPISGADPQAIVRNEHDPYFIGMKTIVRRALEREQEGAQEESAKKIQRSESVDVAL